jgi:N-acetylglucosamine malate deacetylase 1
MNPVAVIAAHPDDEVLGCGGTIARMASDGRAVHVLVLADGESSRVADQKIDPARLAARRSAAQAAGTILGCASVEVLDFPDNRLDTVALLDVVKAIEAFVERHAPYTVMTHHGGDVNVDHHVVHEAVIAACRPQPHSTVRELLFFEVPSSTEWRPAGSAMSFAPNWFVDVTATFEKKLEALREYESELRPFPHARSIEGVAALARSRGVTVGVAAAEAFMVGRVLVGHV